MAPATDCGNEHPQGPLPSLHSSSQVVSSQVTWNIPTSYTAASTGGLHTTRPPGMPVWLSHFLASNPSVCSQGLRIKSKGRAWPSHCFCLPHALMPGPPLLHAHNADVSSPLDPQAPSATHTIYRFPSPVTPQEGSSHLPGKKRYTLPHCLFPIYHLGNQLVKNHVFWEYLPRYTRSFMRSRLSLSCPPSYLQHPGCCFSGVRLNIRWLSAVWHCKPVTLIESGNQRQDSMINVPRFMYYFFLNYVAAVIHKISIPWKASLISWLLFC